MLGYSWEMNKAIGLEEGGGWRVEGFVADCILWGSPPSPPIL